MIRDGRPARRAITVVTCVLMGCGGGDASRTDGGGVTPPPAVVAPAITAQPQHATVTAGQEATFSVTATGTAPLAYQWRRNGAPIASATTSSYATGVTVPADSGAQFSVVVSNTAGSVTSTAATLTVNPAPVAPAITAQPQHVTVTAGQVATFSVTATGTAPLAYQWRRNGANIAGATTATFTTAAVVTGDNGAQFSVVVSNAAGSVTSTAATLTVNPAPVAPAITAQPQHVTVTAGEVATFSVTATGTAPLAYQWRRNGANIAGATTATFTTAAVVTGDNGAQFSVVISNAAGSVTSTAATLTVNPAPVAPAITTQPQNVTVAAGQVAAFSVVATGTAPLAYQWRRNGANIAGATAATFTTAAVVTGDNGAQFSVVVSNAAGSVTSTAATLTVNSGSTFNSSFRVYQATNVAGPWTQSTMAVTGADAGLVDPAPILMPDQSILLYYLMSYVTNGDPAASQPNNQWKFGVARSTDHGATFAHQRTVYTYTSSATDPFPLRLASGDIRLLSSHGSTVRSVTASDNTGVTFPASLDAGTRATTGGVPGALRVGTTYYLYVCSGGSINYLTSTDGLTFGPGGTAIAASGGEFLCDPSPIDDGGGRYVMAYKRLPPGGRSPGSDEVYVATSTNGITWTGAIRIGAGSVPGLVKTATGTYRIFSSGGPPVPPP